MSDLVQVRSTCRLCNSPKLVRCVPLADIPVVSPNVGMQHDATGKPLTQIIAPLDNYLCQSCGLIQLVHIVDAPLIYRDYLYRTTISQGLPEHFRGLAETVLNRMGAAGAGLVCEFGSNDGTLLRFFKDHGLPVQGVDPARNIAAEATAKGVPTLAEFFTVRVADRIRGERGPARIILANNAMANIDSLTEVFDAVKALLSPDGMFVFETQYALDVFEKTLLDVMYHEHVSTFSVRPVDLAAVRHGLCVFDVERIPTKGGSIRFWLQHAGGARPINKQVQELITLETRTGLYDLAYYTRFSSRVAQLAEQLHVRIDAMRRVGGVVGAYGASVGCVALIHQLQLQNRIDVLFDDSPFKPRLDGPGYNLPVMRAEGVYQAKPSVIIILAWRYAETIMRNHEKFLAEGGTFIVPLPELSQRRYRAWTIPQRRRPLSIRHDRFGLIRTVRRVIGTPLGHRIAARMLDTMPGRHLALSLAGLLPASNDRRIAIEKLQRLNGNAHAQARLATTARKRHEARPNDPVRFDMLAIALVNSGNQREAQRLLHSPSAAEVLATDITETSILGARVSLGHEIEDYPAVLADARRGVNLAPELLRDRADYLKCAYAAGKMLQQREALELFGRHYQIVPDHPGAATDREIEKVVEAIANSAIATMQAMLELDKQKGDATSQIGVFFLNSVQALGHAVLDPYHFIALNRDRFDRLVFIGPPRAAYRPASRACLQIIEQYGDYLETSSDLLGNLAWMSLGHHSIGRVTLLVDHYWSLLRAAVYRTRNAADPFRHNGWHLRLPDYFAVVGEAFCRQHGIDLTRPLVVLHVRDSGYHGIERQSFRDASVEDYRDAIGYLLDRGYVVVRLGDRSMPRLEMGRARYFELPFLAGYRHEFDSFMISRSRFMIGCQSGPCAFARALGVPLLTVNAVLHYTLLPAFREMVCFKRYFRVRNGERIALSLADALDARAYQLDNAYQVEAAQLVVQTASIEEITAATRDMDVWMDDPDLPETAEQSAFRQQVATHADALAQGRYPGTLAIADYIGICLDGYRLSPTVARMREEYLLAEPGEATEHAATRVVASAA